PSGFGWIFRLLLAVCASLLVSGCLASGTTTSGAQSQTSAPSGAQSQAAAYCAQSGGAVETRFPFYDPRASNPLQLAGSMQVCVFTSQTDQSRILVALDTLYAEQ